MRADRVTPTGRAPVTGQPVRVIVWVAHLVLPLLGLWLLLAAPAVDLMWQDHLGHLWLVLVVAAINVVLAVLMGRASRRRADARLFLIALMFGASAVFLALHALATPRVLLPTATIGFDFAQPVGLTIASILAVLSSLRLTGSPLATARWQAALVGLVLLAAVVWGVVSLGYLPPLNAPAGPRDVNGPMTVVGVVTIGLYALSAIRYFQLYRRRPAAVLLSIITAFVLLAESEIAVIFAVKWHLSWWEWHLLLLAAYGFVAYSAHVQFRREGTSAGIFDAVSLNETVRRIRAEYEEALEELVDLLQRQEHAGRASGGLVLSRVAARFGLTEGQAAVLGRAGDALAAERGLSRRLGALVTVGEQARVGSAEVEFLRDALETVTAAYGEVRIELVADGTVRLDGRAYRAGDFGAGPISDGDTLLVPLTVKGIFAGVVAGVAPGATERDVATLRTLASQLSIALENSRLYRELETLFRSYLSPDVAAALLADPGQAALGGTLVEVTALFADLRGFTTFSERVEPAAIVTMLNRYHSVAVPCVLDNGGTVVQFVGDALLALFNAPARQPDHVLRAVRAALGLQEAVERLAAGEPDWPRFRVGANTGPALVGNIGSEQLRGFNAMGDAVNVAARLQTLAEPGQVVIGDTTRRALGESVITSPLGELSLKGKTELVRAHLVTGLVGPRDGTP
ncbi:MAG TPA: adenylate/guanylate cyclase domain-containing protein [Pseudonocardia sp.]|jgi:class 3 adenylate cyclase|nr:adenylate/guanylate cyclase domain-containing protein [Pseudonocardia sp.]